MEWSSSGRSGLGPGRLVLTARAVRNARDAQRNPDHADTSAGGGQRAGSRKRLERALSLGSLGQAGQQQRRSSHVEDPPWVINIEVPDLNSWKTQTSHHAHHLCSQSPRAGLINQ
ncbi:hypothetical protein MRB53_007358 [Persea americana]|uniref:Uncharacterized protein n=1 Tax=Persea americana TaxID=3435 RepID=A0ACC2MIR7_PERAE|nr:hypothetical protein MRB53_007358 [Persea americana]